MVGLLRRPRFEITFHCLEASVSEPDRGVRLRGHLVATNRGVATTLTVEQFLLLAGSRRITLPQPGSSWRGERLEKNGELDLPVEWSVSLDAPLRVLSGELLVTLLDHRGRKRDVRCPFDFVAMDS